MQLRKGDTFQTRGAMRTVEFKVMDIATATEEEAEYCYINEDTEILYEGEALKVNPSPFALLVSFMFQLALPLLLLLPIFVEAVVVVMDVFFLLCLSNFL